MKKGSRIIHLLIIIILVMIDQITKIMAANSFSDGSSCSLIDGVLRLVFHKNTGAVWGTFSGGNTFFIILVPITLIAVIWFYFRLPKEKFYTPLRVASILVISGATGNLIDRIRVGYVIDFIYFELIDFPVFNIADSYLTVAEIFAIIMLIVRYRKDKFQFLSLKKERKEDDDADNS